MAEARGRVIFVTGTDTGVGKTVVTATLARLLTNHGCSIGVMKPVESGVADTQRAGADAELLQWAANSKEPLNLLAPYRFKAPLAPDQAAKLEQRAIDFSEIVQAVNELASRHQYVLVEGAGGLMVPLAGGLLIADLVKQLNAELLVVTHPNLGTINHTLLTIFAARTMDIPLCGMVLNRMPKNPDQAQTNAPHALSSLASADLLASFPEQTGSDREKITAQVEQLPQQEGYPWLKMRLGLKADT